MSLTADGKLNVSFGTFSVLLLSVWERDVELIDPVIDIGIVD